MSRDCVACREPVGEARLRAVPGARRCRECQARDEATHPVRRFGVSDALGVVLVAGEELDPAEEMRVTK